jgi:hypothetical protein
MMFWHKRAGTHGRETEMNVGSKRLKNSALDGQQRRGEVSTSKDGLRDSKEKVKRTRVKDKAQLRHNH